MLFRDELVLISVQKEQDSAGFQTSVEQRETVFTDVQAVKRSEFYSGRQSGLELVMTFLVRSCDYSGQKLVEYEGKRYRVERTYSKDGELAELNCSEDRR